MLSQPVRLMCLRIRIFVAASHSGHLNDTQRILSPFRSMLMYIRQVWREQSSKTEKYHYINPNPKPHRSEESPSAHIKNIERETSIYILASVATGYFHGYHDLHPIGEHVWSYHV